MKKITILFALTAFIMVSFLPAKAQGIRLGLKASPSIAWFKPDTDGYNSKGVRLGFSYGLLAEFALAEHYSFATGAHISYFGGRLEYPFEQLIDDNTYQGTMSRTYNLQNLQIPLTIKMKTREIGYNTYFALFGFGNSLNLRAKSNDRFTSDNNTFQFAEDKKDIKSEIPFIRVALIVGLGTEYSLGGNTSLTGGITFNNGFTNILKDENPVNNRKQNAKANYLEVSVGILF